MLKLFAHKLNTNGFEQNIDSFVARVSTNADLPTILRKKQLFLGAPQQTAPIGFRGYLGVGWTPGNDPSVALPAGFEYLGDGDVIRLDPKRGSVRVLYRRLSPHNSFLLTERCNNYCVMCSQPPKKIDDSWIVEEVLSTLRLADRATQEIGFTGGEPTLLGSDLFRILRTAKNYLPETAIHVLTNGRRFEDAEFANAYAAIDHPDLMAGIPLYSDISTIHDYVVQADGAFDETIRGILNLKRLGQRVEIRVVVHKQTVDRLPQLATFISRNLTFVDHVALMGLEMTGFTLANLPDLWIDPYDYQQVLRESVEILSAARMNVSVYNHQLCLVDPTIWSFTRKSISDWKNEYFAECDGCVKRDDCGGFFSSASHRYSDHIAAIPS